MVNKICAQYAAAASGNEMLVLVADYLRAGPTELDIKLPVKSRCIVTDMDTREEVGDISDDEWLTIPLQTKRVRLLHAKPKMHAQ